MVISNFRKEFMGGETPTPEGAENFNVEERELSGDEKIGRQRSPNPDDGHDVHLNPDSSNANELRAKWDEAQNAKLTPKQEARLKAWEERESNKQ